jgi:Flp pilus assembly pilin Flp
MAASRAEPVLDAIRRAARPARDLGGSWAGGQGVVEYGLILSLSAALAVVLLVFFGGTLSAVLEAVGNAIDAAS